MIRPIEELMAYYAFTIEDAQARKRPRLSATAKAMAVEFEAIMQNQNNIRSLALRFGEEATLDELRSLAEVYLKNLVQNVVDLDSPSAVFGDFDLAFEADVENFVRMQERDRLRKRFKDLEEKVLMSSNDMKEPKLLSNEMRKMEIFEEAEPPRAKSEGSNLWKIIFLLIALAVAAMVVRFVWVLFRT
jgi:hypothetical protein